MAAAIDNVDAQVICVGHTHHPYVLEVGDKLIVNPGSVGQPRDGDPRASYAIVENQRVELKRIEYPVEDTVRTVLNYPLFSLGESNLTVAIILKLLLLFALVLVAETLLRRHLAYSEVPKHYRNSIS